MEDLGSQVMSFCNSSISNYNLKFLKILLLILMMMMMMIITPPTTTIFLMIIIF